jgi:hypothetical protein
MPSKKAPARFTRGKPNAKAKLTNKAKSVATAPSKQAPVKRENSKLAGVIAMLRKPEGATLAEMMKATGWQVHSVRGAISGAIKKKLDLTVLSQVIDDERRYRIPAEG